MRTAGNAVIIMNMLGYINSVLLGWIESKTLAEAEVDGFMGCFVLCLIVWLFWQVFYNIRKMRHNEICNDLKNVSTNLEKIAYELKTTNRELEKVRVEIYNAVTRIKSKF